MTTTPDTSTRHEVLQVRAMVPIMVTLDLESGHGRRFAALVPEPARADALISLTLDTLGDILTAATATPDGHVSNPNLTLGPRDLVMANVSQVDPDTGNPILSPEEEMLAAAIRVITGEGDLS